MSSPKDKGTMKMTNYFGENFAWKFRTLEIALRNFSDFFSLELYKRQRNKEAGADGFQPPPVGHKTISFGQMFSKNKLATAQYG